MLYRENGQFKTSYAADQQLLPIVQDRLFVIAMIAFAFVVVPFIAGDYLLLSIIVPFLILTIAAIGLNLLVGYCGQISVGHAAFMAVGAYAAYNLVLRVPQLNFLVVLVLVDDVALPAGKFRLRGAGSAGGHNGLKSLEGALQRQDYARLRIGVGPFPAGGPDLADFVLDVIPPEDWALIEPLLDPMAEAVECWLEEGIEPAMNRFLWRKSCRTCAWPRMTSVCSVGRRPRTAFCMSSTSS